VVSAPISARAAGPLRRLALHRLYIAQRCIFAILSLPVVLFSDSHLGRTKPWDACCFDITVNLLHHSFVVEVKPLCQ
jgi:hypothetical protein